MFLFKCLWLFKIIFYIKSSYYAYSVWQYDGVAAEKPKQKLHISFPMAKTINDNHKHMPGISAVRFDFFPSSTLSFLLIGNI